MPEGLGTSGRTLVESGEKQGYGSLDMGLRNDGILSVYLEWSCGLASSILSPYTIHSIWVEATEIHDGKHWPASGCTICSCSIRDSL